MDEQWKKARALAAAIRDGVAGEVDDVEVIASCQDRTSYTVENDLVIPALERASWSVAMRALSKGRLATAATTSADAADSIAALRKALGAAQPDALGEFAVTPAAEGDARNADPKLWALVDSPAQARALAVAIRDGARAARPGEELVIEAELSVSRARRAIVTGRGQVASSVSTAVSAFIMLDGNDWDAFAGTHAPERPQSITELGRTLVSGLPREEVTCEAFFGGPREVTAVLHPRLVEALLRSLLLERVALDRVLSGLSSASVGDVVAHAGFSLTDDTGAARSLRGDVTDDEGTPGARKALVTDGVLRCLLSDRRSAKQRGEQSTGNGFRLPILAEDRAEAPVRVGFGHLEVSPGDVPRDALVRGKTVLITDLLGIHSANKATGAFNNPIQGGLALQDGVAVARVKPGAWSTTGNFHAALKAIAGISRERLHTGSALLPWIAAPVLVA